MLDAGSLAFGSSAFGIKVAIADTGLPKTPPRLVTKPLGSSKDVAVNDGGPNLAPSPESCVHDDNTFRCVKFIKNYDGDTATFEIPGVPALFGKNISVRLLGIDTPEKKGRLPCEKETARTAQRMVESILKNAKRIDLIQVDRDKYFRILANVIADGISVGDVLLKNGLAYPYDGGTKEKRNWCGLGR